MSEQDLHIGDCVKILTRNPFGLETVNDKFGIVYGISNDRIYVKHYDVRSGDWLGGYNYSPSEVELAFCMNLYTTQYMNTCVSCAVNQERIKIRRQLT